MIARTLPTTIASACVLLLGLGFLTREAAAFFLNPQLLLPTAYPTPCTQDHAPKITSGLTNKPAASAGGTPERIQGVRTRLAMGFSFTFPTFGKPKTATNAEALSGELFHLLSDKNRKVDDDEVMEKIERLEAAGVPFNEDYLFDGPWRVLWKTNTAWQRYFDPFKNVADNRAYQWYKKDGSVTNIAQAFGEKLYVTVDGQGTPASKSKKLPYEVNVEVYGAWLHALGQKFPLDFIKGKGTTYVVYNDPKLRVFRSDTGGVVVQTKAEETVPV